MYRRGGGERPGVVSTLSDSVRLIPNPPKEWVLEVCWKGKRVLL